MTPWESVKALAALAKQTPPERRDASTVRRAVLNDRAYVVSKLKRERQVAKAPRFDPGDDGIMYFSYGATSGARSSGQSFSRAPEDKISFAT